MIGGFDQQHFFKGCTPAATRAEVRRLFEAAGQQRLVHPLPVRQFLRGRAGTDQGVCRRGEAVRVWSGIEAQPRGNPLANASGYGGPPLLSYHNPKRKQGFRRSEESWLNCDGGQILRCLIQ